MKLMARRREVIEQLKHSTLCCASYPFMQEILNKFWLEILQEILNKFWLEILALVFVIWKLEGALSDQSKR